MSLSDALDGRQRGCYAAHMLATLAIAERSAAALAWLGRHGTIAVALSILLGIALPPLGALIRPFFAETVFLLLCLAFLRVEPAALRVELARPRLLIAAAAWTMLVVPVLAGLAFHAFDLGAASPALLLALMFNVVAPPIFSSPALADADGAERRDHACAVARLRRGDAGARARADRGLRRAGGDVRADRTWDCASC